MVRPWLVSFVLVGGSILPAAHALAQSRDVAGAEKLYSDGEKLRNAGNWVEACAKFEGSLALDPAAGTLLQLVACAERDGKVATAWARLKEARSLNADTPSEKTRTEISAFIDAAIARIEPTIPMLRVDVVGPTRSVVKRDGQAVIAAVELPVDPGIHTIVVQADGFVEVTREVQLTLGQRETLTVRMDAVKPSGIERPKQVVPGVSPPREEPKDEGLSGVQVGGLIVGSVGVATLVTSIALGVVASSKAAELEALGCEDLGESLACGASSFESATQLSSEGRTLATVSTVTTFVGAAALGAGVLMLALGGGTSTTGVGVVPLVDRKSAGFLVVGSFQ
jgi:hypothetical protein